MKKFIALVLVLVMVLSLSTVAFAETRTLFGDTVGGIFGRVMDKIYDRSPELANLIYAAMNIHNDIINGITGGIHTMAEHFQGNDFLANGLNKCVHTIGTAFHYVYAFTYAS